MATANEGAGRKTPRKGLRNLRRARRGRARQAEQLPDRRVIDPPKNLRVAVGTIIDPFGIAISAKKESKRRRDGSTAPGEGEWVSTGQPQIVVLRSIRTDPLGWMHSHDQINESQYLAGRKWQSLYERSHVGSVKAVDTSKEPVDGGRFSDPMTDTQRLAIQKLRDAANALVAATHADLLRGRARARLIHDVLATGMFIKVAAASRGIVADRQIGALAKEFRECLTVLADHFGYSGMSGMENKRIRGWRNHNEKNQVEGGRKDSQGEGGKEAA